MSANTIGVMYKVTNFGESHGRCIGTIIDGCPAGLRLSEDVIQKELDRRKGQSYFFTQRKEEDKVEIVSGVFKGVTTGAPICMMMLNKDVDSTPYEKMKTKPRPGHADFASYIKYGGYNDYRGGGRFSGRVTAGFVMAGALAKRLLTLLNIEILAHTIEIAGVKARPKSITEVKKNIGENPVGCGDLEAATKMLKAIDKSRNEGDSVGGIVEGIALNVPAGLGEPIFDTLDGDLAKALFAIPAVKGVEFGSGFRCAQMKGSENNDAYTLKGVRVLTETNNSGGILGGISNGMPIVCRVAIKPTPSISMTQKTIDIVKMEPTSLQIEGRYDSCIVPRALPIVESMMAIVLVDHAMRAGIIPRTLRGVDHDICE
ncbi:MAG: chorismate synthase [Nitrososphaeria archaeon]